MRIYRCDKCGHEESSKQIVGHEFDYSGRFQSLTPAYQFNGVIDVCKKCYDEIVDARLAGLKEAEGVMRKTFLQRLGIAA